MELDDDANSVGGAWHVGAREVGRRRLRITEGGVPDPETFDNLSIRKREWTENGMIRTGNKEKIRMEGRRSPDRGLPGCIVISR